MSSKVENLVKEICSYEPLTFRDVIEDRLDKSLKLYIDELDKSSERLLGKKSKPTVYKELGK